VTYDDDDDDYYYWSTSKSWRLEDIAKQFEINSAYSVLYDHGRQPHSPFEGNGEALEQQHGLSVCSFQ